MKVDNTLSNEFEVMTVLRQGDAFSPLLFNIAQEKIIRSVQKKKNNRAVNIDEITTLDILGFADNRNILGEDKESVLQNTATLII